MRVVDSQKRHIDYRLNLLGVRVTEGECQLISKDTKDRWQTLGPRLDLPFEFPRSPSDLADVSLDGMSLTAYQYDSEHPDSDIRAVLGQTKDFSLALEQLSPSVRKLKRTP